MKHSSDGETKSTFIVNLWANVFYALRWISVFRAVRTLSSSARRSYRFVDAWVLGNLILALVGVLIFSYVVPIMQAILVFYGVLRVIEIIVYQLDAALFEEYHAKKAGQPYKVRGFRRLVVLLLHNYIEIVLWFAMFYLNFQGSFEDGSVDLRTAFQTIAFSFHTMTSFGYAATAPIDGMGYTLTLTEAAIGVMMILIVLARFIALLPEPETYDDFE